MCAFNHQRSNVQIPCIADASRPILTDQEVSIEANFNHQWFDGRQIRFKGGKKCNIRYVSTFIVLLAKHVARFCYPFYPTLGL